MIIENIALSFIQIMVLLMLVGILFYEYFNVKIKNKKYVLGFIFLTTAWFLIFIVIMYVVITEYILNIHKILAIILILSIDIGFLFIFIKKRKFFNKNLVIIELILLSIISFAVIKDGFNFAPWALIVMPPATFFSTWIGYFIVMEFLINSSNPIIKNQEKKGGLKLKK